MLSKALELTLSSAQRRATYLIFFGVALLILVWQKAIFFSRTNREPVDFDLFYLISQMLSRGEVNKAYHFLEMVKVQEEAFGKSAFLPWTYPPQFDLLIYPLSALPPGSSYTLFISITLLAYVWVIRRIAPREYIIVLSTIFPSIAIAAACGQNGFFTGALIGLVCLLIEHRPGWAGLPLGMMAIKPHLGISLGTYVLVSRQPKTAIVAVLVVGITSAFATAVLGVGIWIAVWGGLREAGVFLEHGLYPLHRMVSVYAAVRSLGVAASVAICIQVIVAAAALLAVSVLTSRARSVRQALGFAVICSLLPSPYAYDYDVPTLGIGLALLMPDLLRLASDFERTAVYVLMFLASGFGLFESALTTGWSSEDSSLKLPSFSGIAIVVVITIIWKALRREPSSGAIEARSNARCANAPASLGPTIGRA